LHESCGVFGIYAPDEEVARYTFFALFALQHRGQESSGIAVTDGQNLKVFTGMGLVSQVFTEEALKNLTGHMAIGHNRYSTSGSSRISNAQPLIVGQDDLQLAVAHNGNISNAHALKEELLAKGYKFHTSTDSEVLANLIISAPEKTWEARLRYAMRRLEGAYSLVLMTKDTLYGVRDTLGNRPLCLGHLQGNGYVIASETCALDHINAELIYELDPGEIVRIDHNGYHLMQGEAPKEQGGLCIFEYIYFARPDSIINGRLVYSARQAMGTGLAEEFPTPNADMVIGVPDSATPAGYGYAYKSGISPVDGLIKNRYVGRTFIQPVQGMREDSVKLKFNPLTPILKNKSVVLVDDSIVRGTTTPQIIRVLKKAGAKEVHMRICCPPIKYPCYFGVDMASRHELIASQKSVEEIRNYIGADSLGYLSLSRLIKSVGIPKERFCTGCFTGEYPIPVQLEMEKLTLENDFADSDQLDFSEDLLANQYKSFCEPSPESAGI